MSDRVCIRGCVRNAVHYATCSAYGVDVEAVPADMRQFMCKGCAPEPAAHHSYLCERCGKRLHGLVKHAPDLLGRLRSLADPSKAMVYEARTGARGKAVVAPAPVAADLIDASDAVARILSAWAVHLRFGNWRTRGLRAGAAADTAFEQAEHDALVILDQLPRVVNTLHLVEALAEAVLTVHPVDEHGERVAWSIADAMYRYRAERPDDAATLDELAADVELMVIPVQEWGDRLLSRDEAAEHAGVNERTIRRWVSKGLLRQYVIPGPRGARVTRFLPTHVETAAEAEKVAAATTNQENGRDQ